MGIDNHVWFLDDRFVLRTPRDAEHVVFMGGEIAIWEQVAAAGVRVPPLVAHGKRENGFPYMIVARMEGRLLGETNRAEPIEGLLDELTEQLLLLHSLPVPEQRAADRVFDTYDPWPYFRKAWDAHAIPRMDLLEIEAFMQRLSRCAGNYRDESSSRPPVPRPVLTHNDLHAWNILVLENPLRLSAIIDWGDACVSDLRNDLSTLPLDVLVQLAETYRHGAGDVGPDFEARILWAWLDISFWENLNMEALGFHRPWWRWPEGGWSRVKEILRAAPGNWARHI